MKRIHGNSPASFRRVLLDRPKQIAAVWLSIVLVFTLAQIGWADGRTELKPGWDMFTPEQDIQIGREATRQAERQMPMLNDPRVDNYLNQLGLKLAAHAPGYKYPYRYRCVNSLEINAFALPGGFIFINRGAIIASDDEAQLAGVIAHETSHVALRHGTNQATKANAWQLPLGILGAIAGGGSIGGLLTQLGAGFTVNSILLKNSRADESQADILGTQMLYDSGYDPRAMAQFFEKIQAESKGKEPVQFFSNHPNPGNRIERVDQEVDNLGGPEPNYKSDSPEFQSIKRYLRSLPPPPKNGLPSSRPGASNTRPPAPSDRMQRFQTDGMELRYPDNWMESGQGSAFSLFPDGGMAGDSNGQPSMAYGVMVNMFGPADDNGRDATLEAATDQLIESLGQGNPRMRVTRRHEGMKIDGLEALSTYLANESPLGGRETDWLVTTMRPEGILYFICVAPEPDYGSYDRAFHAIVESVHFPR